MCTVSIAMLSPSASLRRSATRTGSDGETWRNRPRRAPAGTVAEVERLALGSQPAAPHVVCERRHGELLGDLRLAHERARAVAADQVALPDEIVEGCAHREPRNAEVRASADARTGSRRRRRCCSMRSSTRSRVVRLLRHAEHRNRPPVLVNTRTVVTQRAAEAGSICGHARPGSEQRCAGLGVEEVEPRGIESEAHRVPRHAQSFADRHAH